jgi:hypothetical protein
MACKPGTSDCWTNGNDIDPNPFAPSVFLGGHTYYVFLLFAKTTTKQSYDIYVGPNESGKYAIKPVLMDLPGSNYTPNDNPTDKSWFSQMPYNSATGTVQVLINLSNQQSVFDDSKATFCQPGAFCQVNGNTCGCKPGTNCTDSSVCTWGQKELDCPLDPSDQTHTKMGCYGFAITMPADFQAPAQPVKPDSSFFLPFDQKDPDYFKQGLVTFNTTNVKASGGCVYPGPPRGQ